MMRPTRIGNKTALLLIFLAICLLVPITGMGAGPERVRIDSAKPENLALTSGKSVILESQTPIKRFSIADPRIADVLVLTPRQLYLTGKAPGATNLSLWSEGDRLSALFDVEVAPDVASLKEKLHKVFPAEKDIRVTSARDNITLSGTVSSAANLSQILSIAEAYAPSSGKQGEGDRPKVINLLEVGGVHQVMLEVRVSEMSKTLARRLGINFAGVSESGRQFGVSLLNGLTGLSSGFLPGDSLGVSSSVNGILRFLSNGTTWTVFIDALKENGLVKVLAEPTLITMSGKRANFLAGGEYPIPVPQAGVGVGTITIQYKTFGVGLNFIPTVLSNERISMEVAPEVSELDFTNAVRLQGYVVPSLTVRRVSTTVELADGQSFAVAGLLREDMRETVSKFPLLGDIPILGALFRSSQYQKSETELVIIVTPHLVKPVDMAKQPLPTDQFVEPDDLEFYLLGYMEGGGNGRSKTGAGSQPSIVRGGGLDGDFGHIVP
jgi:pilus assembly protein CpaC